MSDPPTPIRPARISPLGDSAWLAEWIRGETAGARLDEVRAARNTLEHAPDRPAGVTALTASYDTLAVRFDPLAVDGQAVRHWLEARLRLTATVPAATESRFFEIPVCYGGDAGPDLADVAKRTGRTPDDVVAIHSGAEYTVAMVGFAPGFPYLAGLPEALHVPRLATPRGAVPAGSVAIADGQAGIYPCASPAGWRVLGRTNARLFEPENEASPALLAAGDRVRFVPAPGLAFPAPGASAVVPPASSGDIGVLAPGAFTTVQDPGRPMHETAGVSPGGAADPQALFAANLLLGNLPHAPALEICVGGPTLRFHRAARIVLVGAAIQGGPGHGHAVNVPAGGVVEIGPLRGAMRAILAIRGGIAVPRVLGACATDARARFGGHHGRALRAGDRLHIGHAEAGSAPPAVFGTSIAGPLPAHIRLRVLDGPQSAWFREDALHALESATFEITTRQDRMGVRLHGPQLAWSRPREMRSQPVANGVIQVPPDGRPLVLLSERQTHGGYPVIASVITADLPQLVRALPGTRVSFRRVEPADAWQALRESRHHLGMLEAALGMLATRDPRS